MLFRSRLQAVLLSVIGIPAGLLLGFGIGVGLAPAVMAQTTYTTAVIKLHVDAGKTTLSEALLYSSGSIKKIGRVDNGDAFLDTDAMEKKRGITIFSKQAELQFGDTKMTLLDTPGHVDFSAEMERTLMVLDYAVLVISASDGVQAHTQTLWRLLKRYEIPVFLFINKMDQPGTDRAAILLELKKQLSDGCIDFTNLSAGTQENDKDSAVMEEIAMEDENAMESFLETGRIAGEQIREMIVQRKIFPCFFGSALRNAGVDTFLQGFDRYTLAPEYPDEFGMKVFKIARDEANNRLTYLKVTGGTLKVKSPLSNADHVRFGEEVWEQKVNQIRIYSGTKYELINEADAGMVCAVTGLDHTYPGQGFGIEAQGETPVLEPVLHFRLILPEGVEPAVMLPKLRQIEEEEPELHIVWNEKLQEIQIQIMGEVQTEILKSMIAERFGVDVSFGPGKIVYKETIADTVEGVGHFEPLRHYAEVHLLLEPLEPGSGIVIDTDCSEDVLDKNWQRLIVTHLKEREHIGVLTGSVITDMKITVIGGRAHTKHTEGGDFRQATYRAVRQGLKQAQSVLLEPYYEFHIAVPQNMVGRAMTDIEKMHGKFEGPYQEGDAQVLRGIAPVACMANYQKEVTAYTKGLGKVTFRFAGYYPCHNTEEVVAQTGYDPERDLSHPADSVFCAHGAGFIVPWNEVPDHMHVEGRLLKKKEQQEEAPSGKKTKTYDPDHWIDIEEIDAILARTYHANKHEKGATKQWRTAKKVISGDNAPCYAPVKAVSKEEYLLVDGYNIIFAWESLKELAAVNIDGARGKLLDILCNYQGIKKCNLIVVFDAYRVKGHQTEMLDHHNIHVVYTKEAETADAYIEKFAHENGRKYHVTVATSDGLEQIIITGQGCHLLSAREFEREVEVANQTLRETIDGMREKSSNHILGDALKQLTDEKIQL